MQKKQYAVQMKAYKEWSKRRQPIKLKVGTNSIQKLSNDNTPIVMQLPNIEDDKIDYSKIKAGDKVWVEHEVAYLENNLVVIKGAYLEEYTVIKHIPVKSALEVAEEELETIRNELANIPIATEDPVYIESILDRYYQARKTFEDLKGKN